MTEDEKERHRKRFELLKMDKERRLEKKEERKINPYVRSGPRNLVEDYYLGRFNDEDS